MNTKRRVVVTGIGMVTPLGLDAKSTWTAVLQSRSGVRALNLSEPDADKLTTRICASIQNFDPTKYLDPKDARRYEPFMQFALAAATEAMQDAGMLVSENNAHRIGVAIGAGMGGLPLLEKTYASYVAAGPRRISPFFIPNTIINMASGVVSIKFGITGPNLAVVTACGTGAHNIACASRLISYGDADVMLAGGTEMATTMLGVGGFASMKALSQRNEDPERASRPWDKDRDGFVLGEGAGVLILEEFEHARRRGANIYAELIGVGMSGDAYHMVMPDPEAKGAARAMECALRDANISKEKIQYINAHGTSTPPGDLAEVNAIKKTFGDHAYKLAVSSTKSMMGHLLGAAGAVEAIVSILALKDNVAPPTINLDNPDDGCDLDFVPHTARSMPLEVTLSNSFGFGGTNVSLIFAKI